LISGIAMALGSSPASIRAQIQASVDLGGASVRYGDSLRVMATTVASTVRLDGARFSALAFGGISVVGGDAWSSQGGLATSMVSRPLGPARIELTGTGLGTLHQDGGRTGQLVGRLRLHASAATTGLWLGGGAGQAWNGATWRTTVEADVAGWVQHNDFTILAALRPAVTGDSIRYTDVTGVARRDGRLLELSASGGLRSGVPSEPGSPNVWASVSAAVWVASQLAVVADVGSYPSDLEQAFPGGTYLSLAVRIASRRRVWIPSAVTRHDGVGGRAPEAVTSKARVEIVPMGGGSYAVRVRARDARRVEIMGDFTEWKPTDLAESGNGWWQLVTRVTPGIRQMTIRIDGGRWTVPSGATVEPDEFGQPVGVVIVP
jgi:hypothetical protein